MAVGEHCSDAIAHLNVSSSARVGRRGEFKIIMMNNDTESDQLLI